MTIEEGILTIGQIDDNMVVYAKRVEGKFQPSSEAVLLELTDEEVQMKTNEIADKYCPDFDYFLEAFLIKDLVSDLKSSDEYKSLDKQVERIIYYAENDA